MTWTVPDQGEPANDLQAVLFQSSLDALAAGPNRTGVVTGCAVTAQGSPDMTVAVAAGTVSLAGATASVTAGNVTIGAADGTNPRLDLVVANGSGTKSVIAGSAAAAPLEPALDTSTYVLLAQVYVPAAATTITTARITDRRVVLADPGFAEARMVPTAGSGNLTVPGTDTFSVTSSFTMSANRANYMPFIVRSSITIDQIVCEVTTLVAASTVRFGIYKSDANGQPTSLMVDSGDISSATTGIKTASVSATLPPGRYLFWTNATHGPTLRSWRKVVEIQASSMNNALNQAYVAQTYGAPPSTGLAWTSTAFTGGGMDYLCFVRRSA